MQNENARNTIIFVALTLAILIAYQVFVMQPQADRQRAQEAAAARAHAAQLRAAGVPAAPTGAPGEAVQFQARAVALAKSPRVPIVTPSLTGSIALDGARLDDLFLCNPQVHPHGEETGDKQHPCYRDTPKPDSAPVELFTPLGAKFAYFARFGWQGPSGYAPDLSARWTEVSGTTLSPGHPVVLGYDSADGLSFRRTLAVDDKYMFTITDAVTNNSGKPLTLAPYGSVKRQGVPDDVIRNGGNVHQGAVGFLGGDLKMFPFKDWKKKKPSDLETRSTGGWLGVTDKYWMAALVPDQSKPIGTAFSATTTGGVDVYEAEFKGQQTVVQPGQATTYTTHLFAGAKRDDVIAGYEKSLHIPNFTNSIDWGRMFWPLTKPIFWLLEYFFHLTGNYGIAILMLTVVVKLLLFPLANQAFASMSKMKKLQPKVEELKKKFGDDQQKQQQEMMALYQREKINPLAGCLPIALQFPVFIALFRVLSIGIDMRHAHFLWLSDLSARDPSTIWNLFGVIPWDPATAPLIGGFLDGTLHVGIVAIIYAGVMYLQQAMSPSTPDPTQQMMMKFMPLIFVFIFARYSVGLMIYWTWSALFSIIQQYVIMHRYKAENPIDSFIARLRSGGDREISVSGG
jgi:YidC/Oxa1 family membrane protein insertase